MRRGSRLVGTLWRWHRRLGLAAAAFVLLLVVTGILLNHSPELALDRRFVDSPWLSRLYGDGSGEGPAFRLGEHWLFRAADGRVYFDAGEVAPCSGPLVGAVQAGDLLVAACSGELLLLTPRGELLEAVSSSTGLPAPLTGVGVAGEGPAVRAGGRWWLANLDALDFSEPVPAGMAVSQQAPGALPAAVRSQIPVPDQWLSWERLLLDLHSGRVLGRGGVWLVDAAGVLLGGLAVSGIAMWWLHRR